MLALALGKHRADHTGPCSDENQRQADDDRVSVRGARSTFVDVVEVKPDTAIRRLLTDCRWRQVVVVRIGPQIEQAADGSVWANYELRPAALLAQAMAVGVVGAQERT